MLEGAAHECIAEGGVCVCVYVCVCGGGGVGVWGVVVWWGVGVVLLLNNTLVCQWNVGMLEISNRSFHILRSIIISIIPI